MVTWGDAWLNLRDSWEEIEKLYLRSTISDDKLNSLATQSNEFEKAQPLSYEDVIKKDMQKGDLNSQSQICFEDLVEY